MVDKSEQQKHWIADIESAFFESARAANHVIDTYGWSKNDIRVSLFGKNSGILVAAVVSMYFLNNHLTHRKWWEDTYGDNFKIFEPTVQDVITCFDGQARSALVLGITASCESSLRVLVRAIDSKACNHGQAPFANIYEYVLNKTQNNNSKPVFEMLRHLRNTKLHSDGIFRPRDGNNVEVEFNGSKYYFEVGKPFNQWGWSLAANLARELVSSLLSIVESDLIVNISEIEDPRTLK